MTGAPLESLSEPFGSRVFTIIVPRATPDRTRQAAKGSVAPLAAHQLVEPGRVPLRTPGPSGVTSRARAVAARRTTGEPARRQIPQTVSMALLSSARLASSTRTRLRGVKRSAASPEPSLAFPGDAVKTSRLRAHAAHASIRHTPPSPSVPARPFRTRAYRDGDGGIHEDWTDRCTALGEDPLPKPIPRAPRSLRESAPVERRISRSRPSSSSRRRGQSLAAAFTVRGARAALDPPSALARFTPGPHPSPIAGSSAWILHPPSSLPRGEVPRRHFDPSPTTCGSR